MSFARLQTVALYRNLDHRFRGSMMRNGRAISALLLAVAMGGPHAGAQTRVSHIPRSQIEEMFANMRANTPWNLNGDLRWGYYFTAFEKPSLEWSATVLSAQGYSVVDISRVEPPRGSKQEIWRLHVERVEHHTPESLSVRNEEFYAFAEKHGLASYDGMDVGPAK